MIIYLTLFRAKMEEVPISDSSLVELTDALSNTSSTKLMRGSNV